MESGGIAAGILGQADGKAELFRTSNGIAVKKKPHSLPRVVITWFLPVFSGIYFEKVRYLLMERL